MSNQLKLYDPFFYAGQALIQLEKALGMATTVHRGYEKSAQTPGSTIKISRPGTFTATQMPHGTGNAQDIKPDELEVRLDQWYGVTFKLTDLELTYTTDRIINDHIRPAAYAVADKIDQSLTALYADVPASLAVTADAALADLPAIRRKMFDNQVPNGNRFGMLNGEREEGFLKLTTFAEADKSSDGGMTQRDGFLGRKYGFDLFTNQNVRNHTPGAVTGGSTAKVSVAAVKGATSLSISDTAISGSLKKGDIITLAGHTQKYAVAADAAVAANAVTVSISPTLQADVAQNTAVTFDLATKAENMFYHRNAFALAMAPLTDIGANLGAKIARQADPKTGLSLRASMWYEGGPAEVFIRIDALWGVKTLDPRLAVRYRSPAA